MRGAQMLFLGDFEGHVVNAESLGSRQHFLEVLSGERRS